MLQTVVDNWDIFGTPALLAGFAGLVLGWFGIFLVARRLVFMSAAVTESAAFGLALGFLIESWFDSAISHDHGWIPLVSTLVLTVSMSMLLAFWRGYRTISQDSLLGAVFVAASLGTLILLGYIPQETHSVQHVLYGTGAQVSEVDTALLLVVGSILLLMHIWWLRGTTFAVLDPQVARSQGLPVGVLSAAVFISIGVMIGLATRAFGALPVFALTTMTAIGVMVWVKNIYLALIVSALFSAFAGFGGYMLAIFAEWTVGPSIALMTLLPLVIAFITMLVNRR